MKKQIVILAAAIFCYENAQAKVDTAYWKLELDENNDLPNLTPVQVVRELTPAQEELKKKEARAMEAYREAYEKAMKRYKDRYYSRCKGRNAYYEAMGSDAVEKCSFIEEGFEGPSTIPSPIVRRMPAQTMQKLTTAQRRELRRLERDLENARKKLHDYQERLVLMTFRIR